MAAVVPGGVAVLAVVVADDGVVVGLVDEHALAHHHRDAGVGDVADPAPTTVRPSEECDDLDERMRAAKTRRVLVTDPRGRLLGVYETDDARDD